MTEPTLVPELCVEDIEASKYFYVKLLEFKVFLLQN